VPQCGLRDLQPGNPPLAPSAATLTDSARAGSQAPEKNTPRATSFAVHLALGIPADLNASDDRLLDEHSFVLSYSPLKRVPNWVAGGSTARTWGMSGGATIFALTQRYRVNSITVSERDYLHSGYDRGHMCPSADREDTPEDNSSTFVFTNMEPQLQRAERRTVGEIRTL